MDENTYYPEEYLPLKSLIALIGVKDRVESLERYLAAELGVQVSVITSEASKLKTLLGTFLSAYCREKPTYMSPYCLK